MSEEILQKFVKIRKIVIVNNQEKMWHIFKTYLWCMFVLGNIFYQSKRLHLSRHCFFGICCTCYTGNKFYISIINKRVVFGKKIIFFYENKIFINSFKYNCKLLSRNVNLLTLNFFFPSIHESIKCRGECELSLSDSGLNVTTVRTSQVTWLTQLADDYDRSKLLVIHSKF